MNLLALETATDACSVALAVGQDIVERHEVLPQGHARRILPMVDEVLAEAGLVLADVDALAFGRGPGAFTGVRIAVSVAQGIAFGADIPVVPVSTLAALAQGSRHDAVLAAMDARMGEVYWGAYRRDADGLMQAVGDELVAHPDAVPVPAGADWYGVGSGWASYAQELTRQCGSALKDWTENGYPHARDVALLGMSGFAAGQAVSAERALPVYLRDEVAWKKIGD